MTEPFREFNDFEIRVEIPKYLRASKHQHYFVGGRKQDKDRVILSMTVDISLSEVEASVLRKTFEATRFIDWMGTEQRLVRRGSITHLHDGFELLSLSHNTVTEHDLYDYHALFKYNSMHVHIHISGHIDFREFDSSCQRIISSFRLTPEALNPDAREDRLLSESRQPQKTKAKDCSPMHPALASNPESYLQARVKIPRGNPHSVAIVADDAAGGVRLHLLSKRGRRMLPSGSSWHPTEEQARIEALQSLGVKQSDWELHEGRPEWSPVLQRVTEKVISKLVGIEKGDRIEKGNIERIDVCQHEKGDKAGKGDRTKPGGAETGTERKQERKQGRGAETGTQLVSPPSASPAETSCVPVSPSVFKAAVIRGEGYNDQDAAKLNNG